MDIDITKNRRVFGSIAGSQETRRSVSELSKIQSGAFQRHPKEKSLRVRQQDGKRLTYYSNNAEVSYAGACENDSWGWNFMLSLRDKIKLHVLYKIGNGRNISVWHDKWCAQDPLDVFISKRMIYEARFQDNSTVADMINEGHGTGLQSGMVDFLFLIALLVLFWMMVKKMKCYGLMKIMILFLTLLKIPGKLERKDMEESVFDDENEWFSARLEDIVWKDGAAVYSLHSMMPLMDAGLNDYTVRMKLQGSLLAYLHEGNPLAGGPARKLPVTPLENKSTVLYIGRIPHGFYENEMEAFFKQFGEIRRIRIARNKKTGKSKHFGFLEFASPEVAKIVAETMHNYLLFEHLLQVQIIPPEHVHPKLTSLFLYDSNAKEIRIMTLLCLWKGVNRYYKPMDWVRIERKRLNKERTFEEHQKLIDGILKREEKRKRKIEAAGIDYKCPEIVGSDVPAPKKIRFED
ncbi:RNA-binding (RRM/RBD/RNP motifs) family protein [Artemisia annua]|uniref:RNA-binding (RRM/RBD/RNP motifs) family protein n=1 Tax=Artemisia annua TaxID=35608 RepID=A0A2U1P7F0_ARTAN|nr:RNA-binding (RRM/RBD/RNP motifs) family protein [Artemisia annua]